MSIVRVAESVEGEAVAEFDDGAGFEVEVEDVVVALVKMCKAEGSSGLGLRMTSIGMEGLRYFIRGSISLKNFLFAHNHISVVFFFICLLPASFALFPPLACSIQARDLIASYKAL